MSEQEKPVDPLTMLQNTMEIVLDRLAMLPCFEMADRILLKHVKENFGAHRRDNPNPPKSHPMDEGGYVAAERKIEEQNTKIKAMKAMIDAQEKRIKFFEEQDRDLRIEYEKSLNEIFDSRKIIAGHAEIIRQQSDKIREQDEAIHFRVPNEAIGVAANRIEMLIAENNRLRQDVANKESKISDVISHLKVSVNEAKALAKQNKEYEAQIRQMHLSRTEDIESYRRKKDALLNIISDLKANFDLT